MDGLTEGRIVHYVMPNGEHRPAIVIRVWRTPDGDSPESGMSNLQLFTDDSNDSGWTQKERQDLVNGGFNPDEVLHGHVWKTSVLHSEGKEPHTWHWIEKA